MKEWYYKYIESGVSPEYDSKKDAELLEWLEPHNINEWEALKTKWTIEGKIK